MVLLCLVIAMTCVYGYINCVHEFYQPSNLNACQLIQVVEREGNIGRHVCNTE